MADSPQREVFVFTRSIDPDLEFHSLEDAQKYISRLSRLTLREDIYIELANVMAAKYNLMSMPASASDFRAKQRLANELTSKASFICILVLGKEAVFGYSGTDLREFNGLVMEIDNQVAAKELWPAQHGELLLIKLRERLNHSG